MVRSTADARDYEGGDLEALSDMPNYTAALLKPMRPYLRGRVIEVGAGVGNIARHYVDGVQHLLLVEPAERLHQALAARFEGQAKVVTSATFLRDTSPALLSEPFDAAIMVNVLEHIHDDLEVLEGLYTLLRPGGALLLFVPAHPWLYGTLDALVHHARRYTRRELEGRVEQAGFSVDRLEYFDVLGMIPWFFAGKVFRRRQFDQAAAEMYDRLGVRITRFFERRFVAPFGKNLLCVAHKPTSTSNPISRESS
jgi:SAM-dependent methyltransferase